MSKYVNALFYYHFTVCPFAIRGWTDGGANEETLNQFKKRATGPKLKRALPLRFV